VEPLLSCSIPARWFWVAWTSTSNLGMESIPISTSRCPDLWADGREYGSFLGKMLTHHSPCSLVATPSPKPAGGYRVARRDLRRLHPLREIVQQLLCRGLMSMDLLQTFFSHRVQPLHQQVTTMWMYSGTSCPNHPFSEELGDMEINSRIHRVFAPGADSNSGVGPAPLRAGVDSIWVSPLGPILDYLCQL
jgi:hypothetical protein